MLNFFKTKISRIANVLILVITLSTIFSIKNYNKENGVIKWDVISYYAYLPATFIYDDISLSFVDKKDKSYKFWYTTADNGGRVIKTSMGVSILYSPFFFMGHAAAHIMGEDSTGFTSPYKLFLTLGAVFYLMLGLYYLRKVLNMFFPQWVTALTCIAIVFGTNLFHYAAVNHPVSHVFSFCLFSIFIYLTIKWHKNKSLKLTILLGLLTGLIALVRPVNIIIVLFFAFYGTTSVQGIIDRISFFIKEWKQIVIMIVAFFVVWIPQFLYWKVVSGQFFFYSYGDEGFFFGNPQIYDGLFSYRNGWLVYSPIMAMALIGIIFFLNSSRRKFMIPIFIFTVLNIYIVLSWWCWWYTGLGLRAFIDSYAILAIPLAGFFYWGFKNGKVIGFLSLVITIVLVGVGINNSVRYAYGSIHHNSMTKRAFWEHFGGSTASNDFWKYLSPPDYEAAKKGIQTTKPNVKMNKWHYKKKTEKLYLKQHKTGNVKRTVFLHDFEDGYENGVSDFDFELQSIESFEDAFSGNKSVVTNGKTPNAFNLKIHNVKQGEKITVSVWVKGDYKKRMLKIFADKSYFKINEHINIESKGDWEKIKVKFFMPDKLKHPLEISAINEGDEAIYYDDLKVVRHSFIEVPKVAKK